MPDERLTPALFRDYTETELRKLLHETVDIGLDFLSGRIREGRVVRYAPPDELIKRFGGPLPVTGMPDTALLEELREVASYSIAQGDPRYIAFPDTADSVAGAAAEILSVFLNQNLIAYDRSAPAGSVIEAQLITWLRELIGYPAEDLAHYRGLAQLGGMWTSGGNMSNHVAIAAALAEAFPNVRTDGIGGLAERPTILLAHGVEHFSYLGAAQVLGLGSESLVWAAPSPDHTTSTASIAELLSNPPEGGKIFMVVGIAGNCRTTGIDDLEALARLCEQHGVWFHVDACHGGSLLFSERLRAPLVGIARADSVSLDPHKGLYLTYPSSYVLFRDPDVLARFARYPAKADDSRCLDIGLITPFYGSRGFESFKLWALLRQQGRRGVADLVERRQRTFQRMKKRVDDTGWFVTLGSSDFYRCAFVFCPEPVARIIVQCRSEEKRNALRGLVSRFTADFAERLYRDGHVVLDLFALQDLGNVLGLGVQEKYQVMGMCVGHPHISATAESEIVDRIDTLGQQLAGEMLAEAGRLIRRGPLEGTAAPEVGGPAGW